MGSICSASYIYIHTYFEGGPGRHGTRFIETEVCVVKIVRCAQGAPGSFWCISGFVEDGCPLQFLQMRKHHLSFQHAIHSCMSHGTVFKYVVQAAASYFDWKTNLKFTHFLEGNGKLERPLLATFSAFQVSCITMFVQLESCELLPTWRKSPSLSPR